MKKIAFPSEDGLTISRHLGRAPYFVVATLQEGQPPVLEQRGKPHHGSGQKPGHASEHGQVPATRAAPLHPALQQATPGAELSLSVSGNPEGVHAMFNVIADCQVLVAGGMGEPAYQRALRHGLEVYLTGEWKIEAALAAWQAGQLKSDLRRVHTH